MMEGEIKTEPEFFVLGGQSWAAFNDNHTLADILRYAVQQSGGSCEGVRLMLDAIEREPSP